MLPVTDRLRAPAEDGALLAVPPLGRALDLLASNRHSLAESRVTVLGQPLAELRSAARRQALAAADHYHWEQGEPAPPPADPARPLVVAGHQPELSHPGVWAKSFAAAGLARRGDGVALNLLVDSDTVKATALRVPLADGTLRLVPFDRWTGETPWEERRVAEPATFAAFGPAVLDALAPWGYRPVLADVWESLARDVLTDGRLLGEAFARCRRRLERAWGVANREVPLGRLWATKAFARLAGAILADLPRFHTVHNAAVRAYRQEHGITSPSHPVPDLARVEGWDEAPFWAWRPGARRQRLFARIDGPRVVLRFGNEVLDLPAEPEAFVRAWCGLGVRGVRLRSRALTTTLAARLLLADLFIHGLGGGLYDALTDVLLRDYVGVAPPGFLILTGTLRLPLGRTGPSADAVARQARLVRDLHYNPHRHRDDAASAALRAERLAWVERTPATPDERRDRFRQLRRLSAALREGLEARIATARDDLTRQEREREVAAHLGRRDFSFVLHPEASLRGFFQVFGEPG